jgi:hypothetical protein
MVNRRLGRVGQLVNQRLGPAGQLMNQRLGPAGRAMHGRLQRSGSAAGLRSALVPVCLAVLVALAALPLTRIYRGDLLTRLLLGAALIPVAISVAIRRLPAWTVAPVSVLVLAGYTLLAVDLSARSGDIPGPLAHLWADALRNGIPRVLTALIPVEPQPDTVLVPVVATWLAGLAGAELVVRYRRVLVGYAPPTLLYAGALVLVGPNARAAAWQALCFAAIAALGLAATGRTSAAPPDLPPDARLTLRVRLTVSACTTLAGIVALAVVVGPALAGQVGTRPTDPRRYVSPPSLDARDENPLIRLSGWALNPDEALFDTDIATQVPRDQLRIRLAVLSDYDGVNWRVDGDYREAGRVLPPVTGPGEPGGRGGPQIHQAITVADLDGRLLPAASAAHQVAGTRVAYDQATGTLIRPEGLSGGLSYTVDSQASTVDVNLLPAADVPSGAGVARLLDVGTGAPGDMTTLAGQIGADTASPYQRAQAIEEFLSSHYTLVSDAPSGHAYPNLDFFLFAARSLGGQRGTSEQFAAAFAVLARMLGLPTRVVVGFQARPGRSVVRGRDALAWPEVLFSGIGWVAFDPLPRSNATPQPVESDFHPKPSPSTPPPSLAPTVAISAPVPAPSRSSTAAAAGSGGSAGLLAGLGGGLLVLLAAVATTLGLLRRGQRLRRLEQGSPAHRVVGAWQEVLDALRLAGRPAGAHLTVTEVATHAGTVAEKGRRLRLAAPSIEDLAGLVNLVGFAQEQTEEDDARRARAQAIAYVDELRARRPWWRRLLWSADPRPLRWHRRPGDS